MMHDDYPPVQCHIFLRQRPPEPVHFPTTAGWTGVSWTVPSCTSRFSSSTYYMASTSVASYNPTWYLVIMLFACFSPWYLLVKLGSRNLHPALASKNIFVMVEGAWSVAGRLTHYQYPRMEDTYVRRHDTS